jgi:GntR family transcriptional regulator/MocR family aminotransferase
VRALTEKRDRMVAAIDAHFPDALATGAASGTHIFLRLPRLHAGATESLIEAARAADVHVYSGRPYYQRAPRDVTLLLGYTTVTLGEIERGVERLAAAYRRIVRVTPSRTSRSGRPEA